MAADDADGPRRPPGRPRDPATDDAILHATLALVTESGEAGLTVDGIAARAGVSKATIYRRWDSKEAVLLAAVDLLSSGVPAPDTGDLREDLHSIATGLVGPFAAATTGRLIAALLAMIATRPELAVALRSGFLAERRGAARAALERERDRGGLRPGADIEVAIDLLAAPFYYRLLVTGAPVDDRLATEVVDAVLGYVASGGS